MGGSQLVILIVAVVAAVSGFFVKALLDRLRKVDVESDRKRIMERAEQDAASKLREADLAIKERELAQKQEAEKELSRARVTEEFA